MGGPMWWYQSDDRRDAGEWTPPDCELCDLAVPAAGERNGAALCARHLGTCDDCHQREGSIELPDLLLCEDCNQNRGEEADERFYADFHGGACSQSVYDNTYARKR